MYKYCRVMSDSALKVCSSKWLHESFFIIKILIKYRLRLKPS